MVALCNQVSDGDAIHISFPRNSESVSMAGIATMRSPLYSEAGGENFISCTVCTLPLGRGNESFSGPVSREPLGCVLVGRPATSACFVRRGLAVTLRLFRVSSPDGMVAVKVRTESFTDTRIWLRGIPGS